MAGSFSRSADRRTGQVTQTQSADLEISTGRAGLGQKRQEERQDNRGDIAASSLLQARNQEIEDPAPRTENRTNLSKQRARTICFLRFPQDAPTRRAKEERPARGKAATSPDALAPAGAPASAGGRCRASAAARGPGATSENTVGFATFFPAVKEHIPVRAR